MRSTGLLALAASISSVYAVSQGFNYGATNSDGTFKYQADYEKEFTAAQNLVGTSGGFTSARLYTTIQGGSSTNEPTQAIPAAIKTKTSLLLGLWATGTDGEFQAQITALKSAISQYGSAFTDLVVGISVGSEDLYRDSPEAKTASSDAGVGTDAATVTSRISLLRSAVKGTGLSGAPVGHVDTWTAWTDKNSDGSLTNAAVISAVDWVGVDAYPYFQNTMSNAISSGKALFEKALSDTAGAVGSKEIWITETGWPVSGKTENLGAPSTDNAKTFWDEVGCPRFGKVNIFWYTLQDSAPVTPNPSFGLVGTDMSTPLYDLSCSNITSSTSSSASASSTSSVSTLSSVVSGALTPAKSTGGSGSGNSTATATGSTSAATGSGSSGGSSSSNSTTTTGPKPVGTNAPTSSVTSPVATGAAAIVSGSVVAGLGALFVAILAL